MAGTYVATTTIDTGVYTVVYIAYTDSGRTTESERSGRASEIWNVRTVADKFGSAPRGSSFGLIDDDIKAIKKAVAEVLKGNIPEVESVWDEVLSNGKRAGEELMAKSEFDFVKNEVKIPDINMSGIEAVIKSEMSLIKSLIPSVQSEIKTLKNSINILELDINKPINELNDTLLDFDSKTAEIGNLGLIQADIKEFIFEIKNNKELIKEADKLQLKRLEKVLEFIQSRFTVMTIAIQNSPNRILKELDKFKQQLNEVKI